jgi:hypothetical protein
MYLGKANAMAPSLHPLSQATVYKGFFNPFPR